MGQDRICIALRQKCPALCLKRGCPAVRRLAVLDLGNGLCDLPRCRGCIRPNAQGDRKEPPNRGGFQLYLNDLCIAVDVVIAIKCCVKPQPRPQRQNNIGLFHQTACHHIAARPHLPGVQRMPKWNRIAMPGAGHNWAIQRLCQRHSLLMAARVLDTAPGNNHRLHSPGQQLGRRCHHIRMCPRHGLVAILHRLPHGGKLCLPRQHIPWQVNLYRPLSRGQGGAKCLLHQLWHPVG